MPAPEAVPVLAVDGPGGSGKGTVAAAVAEALGWHVLDSGALYRVVGIVAGERGLALDDETALTQLARNVRVSFEGGTVRAGSGDLSEAIRTDAAGQAASRVAALPGVRAALLDRQRNCRVAPGLVADGRDMGSVVFPDARLKVFLTASVEERARRRYNQLKQKGIDVSLPALSREMAERDRRDAERLVAPLRPCPDARVLDTTGMSIDDVVAALLRWVREVYPDARGPDRTGGQ